MTFSFTVATALALLPMLALAAPPAAKPSAACAALLAGAGYVPGIDAEGKAVAPADLSSSPAVPTAGRLAIQLDPKLVASIGAGTPAAAMYLRGLSVQNGRAYLDGVPLDATSNAALVAACRGIK